MYKARIKILVKERTPAVFAREVEAEWAHLRGGPATRARRRSSSASPAFFAAARLRALPARRCRAIARRSPTTAPSPNWARRNVHPHKVPGYAIVTLSLKKTGVPPGDVDRRPDGRDRRPRRPLQLRRTARLARAEPDLRRRAAGATCSRCGSSSKALGLATPNIGLLTNIIVLPGRRLLLARQRQVDPDRRGDPAPLRRPRLPARHRRARPQHLRLHERLRPPPRRPHRHPRRRQERQRVVPGHDRRHAGRARRHRQGHRPVVRAPTRCPTWSSA